MFGAPEANAEVVSVGLSVGCGTSIPLSVVVPVAPDSVVAFGAGVGAFGAGVGALGAGVDAFGAGVRAGGVAGVSVHGGVYPEPHRRTATSQQDTGSLSA